MDPLRVARIRRIATAVFFVLGGVLTLIGMLLTPWESEDTPAAYLTALAAEPTKAQVAPLFLHYGFACFAPAIFGALGILRSRGAGLGFAAAFFAFLGFTTLPGFLIIDWYDLAITQEFGVEGAVAVGERMDGYPLLLPLVIPASLGAALAPVLIAAALARAGVAPWWAAALIALGWIGGQATPPGLLMSSGAIAVMLVGLGALAWGILRRTDVEWAQGHPAPTMAATA